MLKTKVINDFKVRPVSVPKTESALPGIFNSSYQNLFICAKKKSGKSQLIFNLVKRMLKINPELAILVFSSTFHKDPVYRKMAEMSYILNPKPEKKGKGEPRSGIKFDNDEESDREAEEPPKKKRYGKYFIKGFTSLDDDDGLNDWLELVSSADQYPQHEKQEYLLIFDDLSDQLKDIRLLALYKKNRHYHCNTFTSSQYPMDIRPESRLQMDIFILFPGHNKDKIKMIYKDMDVHLDFEEFWDLYEKVTKEKYNFLFYDKNTSELRKNLNERIILPPH